jgi:DNA recombination protein RmuC
MSIDPIVLILVLIAGLGVGAALGWSAARPARLRTESELDKERAVHAERLKAYQDAEATLRDAFQAMGAEALKANNQAFLDLAEVRLRETRAETTAAVESRKQAIEEMLAPIAKALEQVDREIHDAERRRIESSADLVQRLAALDRANQELRGQTGRLVDALKRPGVRGRWGELQLKRVVELAGLVEHCDFEEQCTVDRTDGDDRRMRPDVIVRLPGGKHVVIDAKAPLDAYLRALEAPDETSRRALLGEHARQVRAHLQQLAAKGYAAHVQPSADFVVMFLPGEMFFSAALEHDPDLIEFGVLGNARRVIIASPTTLIALLRAVAYGWQQAAIEENARHISDLGRNLYEAVRRLGTHVDTLGLRLKSSLDAYNAAVGSLEGNVLIKARKFKELGATSAEDIGTLDPIDRVPRMLQAPELTGGLPFSGEQGAEIAAETLEEVGRV